MLGAAHRLGGTLIDFFFVSSFIMISLIRAPPKAARLYPQVASVSRVHATVFYTMYSSKAAL